MLTRRALVWLTLHCIAVSVFSVQVHTNTKDQTELAAAVTAQTTSGSASGAGGGLADSFGGCQTCVFVLERIKKGTNMLLPAICSEIYMKYPDAYALCHQVLNALSLNGNNVRYWLFEGCYKYEVYMAKEWVKPCPAHVMCSVLKDLNNQPFCPAMAMENPFLADELKPLFNAIDKGTAAKGDGTIAEAEWTAGAKTYKAQLAPLLAANNWPADKLPFADLDRNGDKKIEFEEFLLDFPKPAPPVGG